MYDIVVQWVREVFIIGILSEILAALMDTARRRRYINFISGLIITLVCVKTIFSFLNADISGDTLAYFEESVAKGDLLAQSSLADAAGYGTEAYIQAYKDVNKEYIERMAKESGLLVTDTDIEADGGGILSIEVSVTGTDDMDKCMEFKRKLSEAYEIDSSNISVNWRKK